MVKRFKLRFSRVIPSFQFCRSKHPSTFPVIPLPAVYRVSPINPKAFDIAYPNFPNPPPSTPQEATPVHPSIRCHTSAKLVSVGFGCPEYLSSEYGNEPPDYTWSKDGRWHVVGKVLEEKPRRKIYSASDSGDTGDDDVSTTSLLKTKKQAKKQKSKKKLNVRTSTSSGDSGWFTSEENEESDTLVSSRSFSHDSQYDFDDELESKSEKSNSKKKTNVKKVRKLKRYVSKNWRGSVKSKTKTTTLPSPETETPLKMSVFRRMMPCTVEGKVLESFAVVKKSEDPYEDFKRSMLEMILEKQMFEVKDLEELLHCFLSLNSRHHHRIIVGAFTEIWEILFSKRPVNQRVPIGR